MQEQYDVAIIGAGACGLMCARELARAGKKVIVCEARPRIGGRIHTLPAQDKVPLRERGAEFIHGELPLTKNLVKEAGLTLIPAGGAIWENRKGVWEVQEDFVEEDETLALALALIGGTDLSIEKFLDTHLPGQELEEKRQEIRQYVEGYYAGDIRRASALAFKEEWESPEEAQYRIREGYSALLEFLCREAQSQDAAIRLNCPVKHIRWKKGEVTIDSGQQTLHAGKALLTIPLGIWQAEVIRFEPHLNHKVQAAKNLGFGPVIKIVLHFRERFWKAGPGKDRKEPWFLFTEEKIPTYWTQFPDTTALLTAWLSGPKAESLKNLTDEELVSEAMRSLAHAFQLETGQLTQMLTSYEVANWITDPYARGAYSFEVVNGNTYRKELQEPVENTLFFGGEALQEGPHIGTVEGALASGLEQARHILEVFEQEKEG